MRRAAALLVVLAAAATAGTAGTGARGDGADHRSEHRPASSSYGADWESFRPR
jgi:hypothetical protein